MRWVGAAAFVVGITLNAFAILKSLSRNAKAEVHLMRELFEGTVVSNYHKWYPPP
eukprot:SAG11_NODE_5768_length_1467_cov_1.254386_3_plen_54_part_01